jgi:hypothetical protein
VLPGVAAGNTAQRLTILVFKIKPTSSGTPSCFRRRSATTTGGLGRGFLRTGARLRLPNVAPQVSLWGMSLGAPGFRPAILFFLDCP